MPAVDAFQITAGQGKTVEIKITEVAGVSAENLGLKTWGAAFILANKIYDLKQYVQGTPNVLEIGAGTGLSGLAAAVLWKSDVIITDLPSIIPGMEANIVLNADLLADSNGRVRCGSLDWASPDALVGGGSSQFDYTPAANPFEVILAADTLYSEDHPGLMADTIFRWLARTRDACFIVCYAQRIAYLDHIRELWRLLEAGGLTSVQEGSQHGDATWDEEAPFEWAVFKWKDFQS